MKGNADLDGRTGFFRGAQGPSGAVFGLESTFGVRSNSARSRSRSKEAIQTLHQAILCGRVVSGDVFHVGTHQNEPPRPELAFGCPDAFFGDPRRSPRSSP